MHWPCTDMETCSTDRFTVVNGRFMALVMTYNTFQFHRFISASGFYPA